MIDFLRNGLQLPALDDSFDKKMFLLELEYWGLPQSEMEYKLRQVFENEPKVSSPSILKLWQQHGIFDISQFLIEKKFNLDPKIDMVKIAEQNYEGQKPNFQFSVIGRQDLADRLIEGSFILEDDQIVPFGFARIISNSGVYLGKIENQI